ncbi:MAG: hypothetical protein GSR80_000102 [Desulfurococcales archaeon]|nr:hypothetical protein [Desulfurococcales archaeon]
MAELRLPGYLRALLQLARRPDGCAEWTGSPKHSLGATWNDFYMLQAYGMVTLEERQQGRRRRGRACLTRKAASWILEELCHGICPALLCEETRER